VVERDGVPVLEAERGGVSAALGTADRVFARALDDGVGPRRPALGTAVVDEGSSPNAPSRSAIEPVLVAMLVTSTSRMWIAIASPTSAPSTRIGRVTSWPPRNDGVTIGPQHPGGVYVSTLPPSATVPAHS